MNQQQIGEVLFYVEEGSHYSFIPVLGGRIDDADKSNSVKWNVTTINLWTTSMLFVNRVNVCIADTLMLEKA